MRPHQCHAYACYKTVHPRLLMCRPHWYMVPKKLRDRVWETYIPGQENGAAPRTREYLEAAGQAIKAVRDLEDTRRGTFQPTLTGL